MLTEIKLRLWLAVTCVLFGVSHMCAGVLALFSPEDAMRWVEDSSEGIVQASAHHKAKKMLAEVIELAAKDTAERHGLGPEEGGK